MSVAPSVQAEMGTVVLLLLVVKQSLGKVWKDSSRLSQLLILSSSLGVSEVRVLTDYHAGVLKSALTAARVNFP